MNNQELTQEILKLAEHQAKCDAERDNILSIIDELRADIKSTKALAEDVHILAINMENIQKTVDETNKKVDSLNNKEYFEYKENKKIIKQNTISSIIGALVGLAIGIFAFIMNSYMKGGF